MDKPLITTGEFSWAAFFGGFLIAGVFGSLLSICVAAFDYDNVKSVLLGVWLPVVAGVIPGAVLIAIAKKRRWTGYIAGGITGISMTFIAGCLAGVISVCAAAMK